MEKKIYRNNRTNETTLKAAEAMNWHRNGDSIYVGHLIHPRNNKNAHYFIVVDGATRKERDADRENWEHCRRIAEEVEAYADGLVHRCPDCGNRIQLPENVGDKYRCPDCGQVHDLDDLEQLSIWDYMEDILDIEYRCGSDRKYRSCQIMVAYGGPNIYIDTASGAVELYWWTDRAKYYLDSDAVSAVDDWAEEYWNCL